MYEATFLARFKNLVEYIAQEEILLLRTQKIYILGFCSEDQIND